jgi:hypothetical protein
MEPKTEVLTVRVGPTLSLKLKREAGPHGSVSSVIRSILATYYANRRTT